MAMYCAVHSAIPRIERSLAIASSRSRRRTYCVDGPLTVAYEMRINALALAAPIRGGAYGATRRAPEYLSVPNIRQRVDRHRSCTTGGHDLGA
jgi:hypothetical protein